MDLIICAIVTILILLGLMWLGALFCYVDIICVSIGFTMISITWIPVIIWWMIQNIDILKFAEISVDEVQPIQKPPMFTPMNVTNKMMSMEYSRLAKMPMMISHPEKDESNHEDDFEDADTDTLFLIP